jgi:tetratricopeptide (TPR) repeat protein
MTVRRLFLPLLGVALLLPPGAGAQLPDFLGAGLASLKQGKYDDAVLLFSAAIKANPQDARGWTGRAYAYSAKRDLADAIRDGSEAVKIDPSFAKAHSVLGNAYWLAGKKDMAEYELNQAVKYGSNDPDILYNRALFYLHRDSNQVIADCTAAIRLKPEDEPAYYIKGDAYLDQQQYEDAIRTYTEAIRLDPNSGNLYHQRGVAYGRSGDLNDAIDDYTRAIALKPRSDTERFSRGYTYAQKQEYDKAIDDYGQAILLNPKNIAYYFQRATLYEKTGQKDLAAQDMKQVALLTGKPSITGSN